MSAERNTEIWSTRLQRELLALTTDNAPEDTKDEVTAVLPPFVTVKDHQLDIANGDCMVSFTLDLAAAEDAAPAPAAAETEGEKPEGEEKSPEEQKEPPADVVVVLDASLQKKPDGSVDAMAVAYPFLKPVAVLKSGATRLPEGSTVNDGDLIDIEMDWTPSLHLTDAILNISLKLKESILQGEPFHSVSASRQDPVEDMVNRARRLGSSFSKGLRGLTEKTPEDKKKGKMVRKKKKEKSKSIKGAGEVRIGDEINMLDAPWVDCQGVYSCKAIRRPAFVDEAMAVAAQVQDDDQVRPSILSGDDGEVPDRLGDYMRVQIGGVSEVCPPAVRQFSKHHLSFFRFLRRRLVGCRRWIRRCWSDASYFHAIGT